MGLSSFVVKLLAKKIVKESILNQKNAILDQEKVLNQILANGEASLFGKNHQLSKNINYQLFREKVPISDYESIKPYIEKLLR